GKDRLRIAIDFLHEAVHDAPRRAPRECPRQPGGVVASAEDRLLVALRSARLVGGEERGAELHGRGAQGERGRDAAPVHDAAGSIAKVKLNTLAPISRQAAS